MKKYDHLFLLDGSSYIFRSYYAFPKIKSKKYGIEVGAVFGFFNMLWRLLKKIKSKKNNFFATHFAIIIDHSSNNFRKKIFPAYKSNRKKTPKNLIDQFNIINKTINAFNIPLIKKKGFEADDIIATYCNKITKRGGYATIISSDKDFMQLVNKQISIYDERKNIIIRRNDVFNKWGVYPEKMIDFQSLTGDYSDNIPGIRGIGPKNAAKLITKFGNLENIIDKVYDIPQKRFQNNIIACAKQARLSKILVKLIKNVPVDINIDQLIIKNYNKFNLVNFLNNINLNNSIFNS